MHRTLGAPWFVLILAVSAAAQEPDHGAPRQTSPYAGIEDRQFRIGRIESAQAPVLDGWLDDPVWQDAPEIGPLVETEPRMGLVPRQDTVVRIIHDARHLYIAVWCFDEQPDEIRANLQARDTRPEADDRISIIFDTFFNRRTGFQFGG